MVRDCSIVAECVFQSMSVMISYWHCSTMALGGLGGRHFSHSKVLPGQGPIIETATVKVHCQYQPCYISATLVGE